MDLSNSMAYVWLIIAFFFLLLEMGSPGLFFFISFFLGGLLAAGSSLVIISVMQQIAVFFVGTVVALVVLRHWIIPLIGKDRPSERTNVYALVGKRGFVTVHMSEKNMGMVKVNGVTWAARSVSHSLSSGDEVEVVDIRGTHLIVKKA